MSKSKILLFFSIIFIVQASQQTIYSGVSSYFSNIYIRKSLVNEIKSLNQRNFNIDINFNKPCTFGQKKTLFFKNKAQINPVNNISTYNLQFNFNQISSLFFNYKNGIYETSNTLPLKLTLKNLDNGPFCNSPSTTTQIINIIAKNMSFQKKLSNINGQLIPQIGFSVNLLLQNSNTFMSVDPQVTQALTLLQKAFQEKVNKIFAENQSPLIPQSISNQISNLNYQLNLKLINLSTNNPENSNGNYISVLDGEILRSNPNQRQLSTKNAPIYFTKFISQSDAQLFISQSIFSQLYIIPSTITYPVSGPQISLSNLKEIFPDIDRYYPLNSQVFTQFVSGIPQFNNSQRFKLKAYGEVVIVVNKQVILNIGIYRDYELSTIQQASQSRRSTSIKMKIYAKKDESLNKYSCNCGSINIKKLNKITDSFILPWINSNLNSAEYVIPNLFKDGFSPQYALLEGNNVVLNANYY